MSELESLGDPDHVCDEGCLPYEPLASQDLECLEESEHIDALYDILAATREHAALLVLALARAGVEGVKLPARAAAFLLDMDELAIDEAMEEAGLQSPYTAGDLVDLSIRTEGENGYIGRAISALFRLELSDLEL